MSKLSSLEALRNAKLKNKHSVFSVYFCLKNGMIKSYKISFFDYNDAKILKEMDSLMKSEEFDRWLTNEEVNKLRNGN